MIECDLIVLIGCVVTVIIIVILFILPKKANYKSTFPMSGYNPRSIIDGNSFKTTWRKRPKQKGSTMPQFGFNTNRVSLNTMPPNIPTPREYFQKMKIGAAAALPTDIDTVGNALTQGNYAIDNGQIRIPFGKMKNPLYRSWGVDQLPYRGKVDQFDYVQKTNINLDSPSFKCGNYSRRNGGIKGARAACSNTPGCIGFTVDKSNNPICLKSSSEQQRFYKDSNVNYYEKKMKNN